MPDSFTSDFAYSIHQIMEKESINLCYTGDFTPELITVLLLMAKKNIHQRGAMKKVYNIMIESLENLTRHAIKNTGKDYPAIFVIGIDDEHHYLATGNKICKSEVKDLKSKLERVNNLDKKALRSWYNEILQVEDLPTDERGAGLGIIDIALKSGHPLDYKFEEIDEEHDFFVLKITVTQE